MFKCSKCGGADQNSDGSCARCSATLREKLKALVEEWRRWAGSETGVSNFRCLLMPFPGSPCKQTDEVAASLKECSHQLAALLAESEPEPCGGLFVPGGGPGFGLMKVHCFGCSERVEQHPDCEAKAEPVCPECGEPHDPHVLKPGHEFRASSEAFMSGTRPFSGQARCSLCGQPREAH